LRVQPRHQPFDMDDQPGQQRLDLHPPWAPGPTAAPVVVPHASGPLAFDPGRWLTRGRIAGRRGPGPRRGVCGLVIIRDHTPALLLGPRGQAPRVPGTPRPRAPGQDTRPAGVVDPRHPVCQRTTRPAARRAVSLWLLNQDNPLRDDLGHLRRWYATGTDIDERTQAEERTRHENLAMREGLARASMFEAIVGSPAALRRVLAHVEHVAGTDATLLMVGETGTGTELMARAMHQRSPRATRAFIWVNCAAIPPALIAAELCGHEKGACTGALQRRLGRFEAAHGGTIFLDEIGDFPVEMQIALLRVLQEREFERVGSNQPMAVDVRVLAATNRDLPAAVAAGTFRQDLW
jgi:Sigma-54 interaction domain